MDLIIINGQIRTMDSNVPNAEAVAVKDGSIAKVGTNEDVLSLKTEQTKIIDIEAKVMLPGFNDSHMHLVSLGYFLNMADLSKTKSIDDIIEKVKAFINDKKIEADTWVRGRGWNHDYFEVEKRFPTRYDLDKISTELPIVLTRACGHVCVVNSKALEINGVNKSTSQVEGGQFDLDENGEPLGIFRENAMGLVYGQIPSPGFDEVKEMIKNAVAYANSKGLTSVQTDDFGHIPGYSFREVIQAYNELKESGELNLRIYEQCLLPSMDLLREFLSEGYNTGYGDNFFKIGPLKLLGDGSLGARTAALCQPYADDPSTSGILVFTQEELDGLVKLAHDSGMHVAIHSIGDKIMYMAFEAIEKALKDNPREEHRHSIIHCQITDEALINKYKEMDVIAHIQPIFLHYDLHIVEGRIGIERAKKSYAFKTMLEKGIHVGFGTDCPVEALDVMPCIYCAVTRKDLNGYPEGGWQQDERVSVKEAVYAYTMGGAYTSFEENIKGSIAEGKLADMVVLEEDIFKVEHDKIKDIEINMTIVDGKVVYSKK